MTHTRPTEKNWLQRRLQHWKQAKKQQERYDMVIGSVLELLAYLNRIGPILAICISWSTHKSILAAICYGSLSWAYIIYHWISE